MTKEENVQIDFDKIESSDLTLPVPSEDESLLLPDIKALLQHHQKQNMNYVDKRLMTVFDKIKKNTVIIDEHTAQLGVHDKMLQQHAQLIQALQNEQLPVTTPVSSTQNFADAVTSFFQNAKQNDVQTASPQEKSGSNVVDSTLGTIGGVAHGIVDTAAFICESIIDLATLGKAKRGRV